MSSYDDILKLTSTSYRMSRGPCPVHYPLQLDYQYSCNDNGSNTIPYSTNYPFQFGGTLSSPVTVPYGMEKTHRNINNYNYTTPVEKVNNDVPSERKKKRVTFSRYQRNELNRQFNKNKYIAAPQRNELAARIKLTPNQVKIWLVKQ